MFYCFLGALLKSLNFSFLGHFSECGLGAGSWVPTALKHFLVLGPVGFAGLVLGAHLWPPCLLLFKPPVACQREAPHYYWEFLRSRPGAHCRCSWETPGSGTQAAFPVCEELWGAVAQKV